MAFFSSLLRLVRAVAEIQVLGKPEPKRIGWLVRQWY
jgi:hypothetical protein